MDAGIVAVNDSRVPWALQVLGSRVWGMNEGVELGPSDSFSDLV